MPGDRTSRRGNAVDRSGKLPRRHSRRARRRHGCRQHRRHRRRGVGGERLDWISRLAQLRLTVRKVKPIQADTAENQQAHDGNHEDAFSHLRKCNERPARYRRRSGRRTAGRRSGRSISAPRRRHVERDDLESRLADSLAKRPVRRPGVSPRGNRRRSRWDLSNRVTCRHVSPLTFARPLIVLTTDPVIAERDEPSGH